MGADAPAAHEGDRERLGRDARRPTEIPPKGWLAVLQAGLPGTSDPDGGRAWPLGKLRLLCAFWRSSRSSSVAISLYGLFTDPSAADRQLEGLRGVLPGSTYTLIEDWVHDIAATGRAPS